jgi:hypothetical protein
VACGSHLEFPVIHVLVILLLLWALLLVLLTAGTTWLQNAIYSQPATGIYWAGPVTATLLALFFGLWLVLDLEPPGCYSSLFTFSANDEKEFRELRAVVIKNGKETPVRYRLRKTALGQPEYREATSPYRPLPRQPEAILVNEDGEEVRFEPERDANHKLKIGSGQALRYLDSRGRVMSEDMIGRVSNFRWDRFLPYALLNVGHLLLWFAGLWILLRFQWLHALGLALLFWLAMTVLVLPMCLSKAENAARVSITSGA